MPFEIYYYPKLSPGKTDYSSGKTSLSFDVLISPDMSAYKVIRDIRQGLDRTFRAREWGLEGWPLSSTAPSFYDSFKRERFDSLLINYYKSEFYNIADKNFSIRFSLTNDSGKTIGNVLYRTSVRHDGILESGSLRLPYFKCGKVTFANVSAYDITDNLNLSVSSVNDIYISANQDYIKIISSESPSHFEYVFGNSEQQVVIDNLRLRPDYGGVWIVEPDRSLLNVPDTLGQWKVVSVSSSVLSSGGTITIQDNIMLYNHLFKYTDDGFTDFYNSNGKKAGTYSRPIAGGQWRYFDPSVLNSQSYVGFDFSLRFYGRGPYSRDEEFSQAVVTQVHPDSPASKGGIRVDDIITHINDKPVTGVGINYLQLMIKELRSGERVSFTIIRKNKTRTVQVTIGTRTL